MIFDINKIGSPFSIAAYQRKGLFSLQVDHYPFRRYSSTFEAIWYSQFRTGRYFYRSFKASEIVVKAEIRKCGRYVSGERGELSGDPVYQGS